MRRPVPSLLVRCLEFVKRPVSFRLGLSANSAGRGLDFVDQISPRQKLFVRRPHISPDAGCTCTERPIGRIEDFRVQSCLAQPHECWACEGLRGYGIMCTRGASFGACARNPVCKERPITRKNAGFSEGYGALLRDSQSHGRPLTVTCHQAVAGRFTRLRQLSLHSRPYRVLRHNSKESLICLCPLTPPSSTSGEVH